MRYIAEVSKKLVREALELAIEARLAEARSKVEQLDPEFPRKRLIHHMSQPQYAVAAKLLWKALHEAPVRDVEVALVNRRPIALDFRDVELCTQSFLHALLYEGLRLAWAFQVPVYIVNAGPGVRSGLSLVENYALGG